MPLILFVDCYFLKLKFFQNENKVSICINPAQISQTCDFIFICVDKTENVNDVIFGKNGIIQNASKNTIIVDLSTTLADETINFSKRISAEKGSSWIDAPVSGGPEKALDGSLAIMVGAEQKDLDIISPMLEDISSNFTHFGPVGSGQIVKMINQILVLNNYAYVVGVYMNEPEEGLILAKKAAKKAPAKAADANIADTSANNGATTDAPASREAISSAPQDVVEIGSNDGAFIKNFNIPYKICFSCGHLNGAYKDKKIFAEKLYVGSKESNR